jgi:hypothetical protein
MRPAFNTYRDQEHLYSCEKAQIHRIHMQTHHKEVVPELPPQVIPCIKSMNNIYPKEFMRAAASHLNNNHQVQTSDHTLSEKIIIYTDASIQNQISAIAWNKYLFVPRRGNRSLLSITHLVYPHYRTKY